MIKKCSVVLCALLFSTLFLLTCTGESPFKPENATVILTMENSGGHRDPATVTDTVGNRVRINLIGYLPSYIDSVHVLIGAGAVTDTDFTFPKTTSWADSQWIEIVFHSTGTRTVTVTVFVEGKEKTVTATIVVVGKTVNHAPVLDVSGVRNIVIAQTCSLSLSTTDVDSGQTFTYAMIKAPQGATLNANIFKWTPPTGHTGTDTVKFTVTDNGKPPMSDTQTVYITVSSQITVPVKVLGVKAVSKINGYFIFSWNKVSNADSYDVFRSQDTVNFQKIGSTSDSLFGDTVKTGSFYYYVVAVNGAGPSPSSDIIYSGSVNRPPVVQPQSVNTGRDAAITITLVANDPDGDVMTQWRLPVAARHGTATLSNPAIGSVVYTPNAGFIGVDTFAVDGYDGSLWSLSPANVIVTVDSSKIAPKIQTQPRPDTTVHQGGTVTFTVAINNAFPTPTFKWYQGTKGSGVMKDSSTNPLYQKTGVSIADSGNYYVVVVNGSGSDTSTYAHLTVNVPPLIVADPATPPAKCPGDSVSFAVTATGTPPLSYQWQVGGNNIAGATSATYHIASVTSANAGSHTCVVTNVCGAAAAATSQGAVLTVNAASTAPLGATATPTNICAGDSSLISVSGGSLGTGASWKWYTDLACTIPISGINTGATVTVSPASTATYYVRGEGTCGKTTISSIMVKVDTASTAPAGASVTPAKINAGASSTLSVTGGFLGTGASWKWFTNAGCTTPASGANTGASITVTPASTTTYYVRAEGACGNTATASVTVTVVRVIQISSSGQHTLFVKSDSTLWACGSDYHGELCDGGTTNQPTPIQVKTNVISAATGGAGFSFYLTGDGKLYGCGANYDGELGDGTTNPHPTPVLIMSGVKSMAAGASHTLFLKSDETVWGCGSNYSGELGDGTDTSRSTPKWMMQNVKSIAAGKSFSLILDNNGNLYACGQNNYGQLGIGSTDNSLSLRVVMSNVVSISAGDMFSLAVKTDGTVWGWGFNYSGQLGTGSTDSTSYKSPVQMTSISGASKVFAGMAHSLVLTTAGTLWACGDDMNGELCDGLKTSTPSPKNVLTGVQMVAAGYEASIILKTDGTVWSVGYNNNGQLGNGTYSNQDVLVQISF